MFRKCIARVHNVSVKRWLLTDSYQCNAIWNERLNNVDCKVTANQLNIKLQASLNNNIPISALDFDILMNKIHEIDVTNLEYVHTLIRSFRKTQESIKAFESSSHALIKNLIDIDAPFEALNLIRDRANTGIFLDEISTNLLIDKFIINKDWSKAFLTASEWLLQESFELSALCTSLSLYSCLHFWNEKLWQHKTTVIDNSNLPEVYVPVPYLKPDYFDDHFDLTKDEFRRRLLGKCLCLIADNWNGSTITEEKYLVKNIKLLGLALHEKLEGVVDHLEKWLEVDDVKINDGLIVQVEELIGTVEIRHDDTPVTHQTYSDVEVAEFLNKYQNLIGKFRVKECVDNVNFVEFALQLVGNKVSEQSESDRDLVRKKYEEYNGNRNTVFVQTLEKLQKKAVLEKNKKILLDLMEQEERLKFFDLMPEIMYKAWLAKRTKKESRFTRESDEQENLVNVQMKQRPSFTVQHTVE